MRQNAYEPFEIRKAHYEEGGELLGEGLMNLLEDQGPAFSHLTRKEFWQHVMEDRHKLLCHIILKRAGKLLLWKKEEQPLSDDPVVQCMNVAIWAHEHITPQELADYTAKWMRDGNRWRSWFRTLAGEARQRRQLSRDSSSGTRGVLPSISPRDCRFMSATGCRFRYALPTLGDERLPNSLELTLVSSACLMISVMHGRPPRTCGSSVPMSHLDLFIVAESCRPARIDRT